MLSHSHTHKRREGIGGITQEKGWGVKEKTNFHLKKKWQERTTKDARDLRSLKKRLNSYNSAREAVADPFFSDLFINNKP